MEATTPTTIKNTEILYTSVDGKKITNRFISKNFDKHLWIVSHTYEDGIGRVVFDGDVTEIDRETFYCCKSLSSIVIPNSVISIDSATFFGCTSLISVTIGNSVTSIGSLAFYNCNSLSSITIPNSVTSIGNNAFDDCTSLSSIIVEEGNSVYDSRDNCNAIIKTSSNTLLFGCHNTIIPNSVTSIGNGAFYNCTSLSSITIPNSVKCIGDGAFRGCSALHSVTIGNAVIRIGFCAFELCTSLESVIIPNSVTSIGNGAFRSCFSLSSITIPNSVTSIGSYEFYNCILLHNKLSQSCRCFKAFKADMTCRGFKYEEGKDYHCDNIELCQQGFHYCTSILELFNYYNGEEDKDIVIHEVFPSGEIRKEEYSTKRCCSDIKIGRRIKFSEINDIINNSK